MLPVPHSWHQSPISHRSQMATSVPAAAAVTSDSGCWIALDRTRRACLVLMNPHLFVACSCSSRTRAAPPGCCCCCCHLRIPLAMKSIGMKTSPPRLVIGQRCSVSLWMPARSPVMSGHGCVVRSAASHSALHLMTPCLQPKTQTL